MRAALAPNAPDVAGHVRSIFVMERLEPRRMLTIVPIDATAAVPFDGIVATNLHVPEYGTGLDHLNVMLHGQWDYAPMAVVNADGSFDLVARMTPQRAGTDEMTIWFRNERSGAWDLLESGEQTVNPNHFNALVPDAYSYEHVPWTRMRDPLATFSTTELTLSLDNYTVEVNWFGDSKPGRLVRHVDGSIAAYVDNAYLPLTGEEPASVTIRQVGASADTQPVGFARAYVPVYGNVAIGMFYGSIISETQYSIGLRKRPPAGDTPFPHFTPATELEGWHSTFSAEVTWQYRDHEVGRAEANLVRHTDGSYRLVGQWPKEFDVDNAMMRIRETVERPAIDGQPPTTYTIEYVGSFWLVAEPDPIPVEEPTTPIGETPEPMPVGGFTGDEILRPLLEKASRFGRGGFESVTRTLFASDDDALFDSDDPSDISALVQ